MPPALPEKDEEIRRFITGYNLGVKYLQTHPQNEWTEILVKEFGLQEKAAMQIDLPDYRPATRPSYHDIEKIIAWLKSKRAIPDYYPGENLVDTTFIPGTPEPQ